jgi:hypothetical protein
MGQGPTQRYTHVAYALGFIITHEAMMDNLYEKIGVQRTSSLAFSMRQTKENVVANIYNRAFNTSYVGADGKPLFATDHPGSGGTFSNKLATDADLSEAEPRGHGGPDHERDQRSRHQDRLMGRSLIVPPSLVFEATRILKSSGQNDTANNASTRCARWGCSRKE